MMGIGGSASLLAAQRAFDFSSRSMVQSLMRLATGQRINRGADDPAGLIASENFRAAMSSLQAQARTLSRADQVANVADAGLGSASDLLVEANGLAVEAANSAGLSEEERQALQGQLDSILTSLDGIAGDTTFNGDTLLDGTARITAGQDSVSMPDTHAAALGETDVDGQTRTLADLKAGGALNLADGDLEAAQQVIQTALDEVTTARGRVGSFQRYAVGARLDNVQAGIETLAAADSVIRDTNYAAETATFNRALVLQRASMMALSAMLPARGGIFDLLA